MVVEASEREFGADLVGGIFDISFPVGPGGGEVELLFVEGVQGIEVGVARLRFDEIAQSRTSFAPRTAEGDGVRGQRHHAEEEGFECSARVDGTPRGQFRKSRYSSADWGDKLMRPHFQS